jgi:type IV pilus assembly protein PilE
MNIRRPDRGFSLIELMIVVVIVGILAAIAYPSYTEQIARGRRADAQSALLETAQWIERQYTITSAYDKFYKAGTLTTLVTSELPALKAKTAETYTLSFGDKSGGNTSPTSTGFTLRMVPKGAMANDKCGTMTLSNTGTKDFSGSGGSLAYCWDR